MRKLKLCCVLVLFLLDLKSSSASRATFGEPCSPDVRCDSMKFLACSSSGTCDCLMPTSMVLDDKTGQCVTLAGESCEFTTVEGERYWNDEVPCIENATCENGICECTTDHYEISNGTCNEKSNYGEICSSNSMCHEKLHLVCLDNLNCGCRNERVFSRAYGKCVLKAEQRCYGGDTCTENSQCQQRAACMCITGSGGECTENLPCKRTVCKCSTGYFANSNGTCEPKRDLGEHCQDPRHCKNEFTVNNERFPSMMTCQKEICKCDARISLELVLTDGIKICGKLVGSVCGLTFNDQFCVSGAICEGSTYTCQCNKETHFETAERTCEKRRTYCESCIKSDQCDLSNAKLVCDDTSKTCQCDPSLLIDLETKSCKLRVGSSCEIHYLGNDGPTRPCASNAECDGRDYSTRKCTCERNTMFSERLNDFCYIKEDEYCNGDLNSPMNSRTCLPGLLCRNSKCTCPYKGHQVYNETSERCNSYVAGPCNHTDDCVDRHTECVQKSQQETLQCRCKTGYVEMGQRCEIEFGGKCSQGAGDVCDSLVPLECSSRGICECADLQTYDAEKRVCNELVGAKCAISVDKNASFCTPGATCRQIRGLDKNAGICICESAMKIVLENRTCTLEAEAVSPITLEEFRDMQLN